MHFFIGKVERFDGNGEWGSDIWMPIEDVIAKIKADDSDPEMKEYRGDAVKNFEGEIMNELKEITCFSSKAWRTWLSKNHKKEERVLLIRYKKHTGKKMFNQREAMDEAICFGWIDTTLKRIDDERYGVTFVRRNKNSRWSENTFARAREMIKLGKMSKFGLEMFELGLTKKTHDHGIPKNPSLSDVPELKMELAKSGNEKVKEAFERLAPSHKRMHYRMILHAKRPETRMRRVENCIEMVRKNRKFGASGKDV